jgi:hypothetical protein
MGMSFACVASLPPHRSHRCGLLQVKTLSIHGRATVAPSVSHRPWGIVQTAWFWLSARWCVADSAYVFGYSLLRNSPWLPDAHKLSVPCQVRPIKWDLPVRLISTTVGPTTTWALTSRPDQGRPAESPSLVLVINDTRLLMSYVKWFKLGISNTRDEGSCGIKWWPQGHKRWRCTYNDDQGDQACGDGLRTKWSRQRYKP